MADSANKVSEDANNMAIEKFKIGEMNILNKNKIRTRRYSIFDFFFKFSYYQLSLPSNLFFMVISSMQFLPDMPLSRITGIGGLTMMLFVIAINEIYQDRKRSKYDTKENKKVVLVYSFSSQQFKEKPSSEVSVGDIIMLSTDNIFPADVVLLRSSHYEGLVYVSTANLDGESGIKAKNIYSEVIENSKNSPKKNSVAFRKFNYKQAINIPMERSLPQKDLHSVSVFMNNKLVPENSLVFRGSVLRHTKMVIGVVSYAGNDTIMLLNTGYYSGKRCEIDKITDNLICSLIIMIFILSLILTILSTYAGAKKDSQSTYLNFCIKIQQVYG
ncbi:MAG: aminophospholipid translocase [Paramarteilia canceri]